MRKFNILHCLAFTLAFCSIVYELILAQALSAFLENTVLRYCVTIGLYMFSKGVGSMLAEGKYIKKPVLTLLKIEIFLTVIGGFSLMILHGLDILGLSRLPFSVLAHFLIFVIGFLTGFEIPLLLEMMRKEEGQSENIVIGLDYAGAFLGTIIFAFMFYPKFGLMPTAIFVGLLNAFCGSLLITGYNRVQPENKKSFHGLFAVQCSLLIVMVISWLYSGELSSYFIKLYIN